MSEEEMAKEIDYYIQMLDRIVGRRKKRYYLCG